MTGRLAAGTLASRGASNPDALAAFIATRTRDGSRTIGLAGDGEPKTCPNCGYNLDDDDEDDNGGSEALRTPAPSTGYVRDGAPLTVRGGGSAPGLANPDGGLDLATPRYQVTSPMDLLITNSPNGGALVRHRRGGGIIGEVHDREGWRAVYNGKEMTPRTHQRAALADLLGIWNTETTNLQREGTPLQPPPEQTPLMQQYGIPAVRALATPAASVSDGPRVTSGDGDDDSGLSGKSASVYRKLVAKGWDKGRAKRFAANASRFGGSS